MAKTVQVYNQIALYSSFGASTGYQFITYDGVPINDPNNSGSINLIQPLNRIISTSYTVNTPRMEIRQMGGGANIIRPILETPEITLNFDYYLMGLINEFRLGFMVNHPSGHQVTGRQLYLNPDYVCPISGFIDRSFNRTSETFLGWPLTSRDCKNIFSVVKKDSSDFYLNTNIPPIITNCDILAFGDCYVTSYKTNGSVNSIPQASVEMKSSNYILYSGGSGLGIPSINPQTYENYSGIYFSIPNNFEANNLPTVLIPRDITLTIQNTGLGNPDNMSIDFRDIKIQSYDISMNLTREPLYKLGYRAPLDYPINLPSISELNFEMFVGDYQTGNLVNLIKRDEDYNIKIKLNYQSKPNQLFTGIGIQYDFLGAKFNNISFNQSIQGYRTATLSFSTEMDPLNQNKGFFMSGKLGTIYDVQAFVRSFNTYLGLEDGAGILLMENGDNFQLY